MNYSKQLTKYKTLDVLFIINKSRTINLDFSISWEKYDHHPQMMLDILTPVFIFQFNIYDIRHFEDDDLYNDDYFKAMENR